MAKEVRIDVNLGDGKNRDMIHPRIQENLKKRFIAAITEDGIYNNMSDAIRHFIIEYVNKIEAR